MYNPITEGDSWSNLVANVPLDRMVRSAKPRIFPSLRPTHCENACRVTSEILGLRLGSWEEAC